MNTDAKFLNKILVNLIQQCIKSMLLCTMAKWDLFQEYRLILYIKKTMKYSLLMELREKNTT